VQPGAVRAGVERTWQGDVLPALDEYIAVPAVSPAFDDRWVEHRHLADAVELVRSWCAARPIEGLSVWVHELEGRTPVVVCEVDAFGGAPAGTGDAVLLYGHLDKQPPMEGWHEGLGPWTPVRRGDLLFGRGGADDGYAAFAALAALEAVQHAGGRHARCALLVEASEESGSPDLPAHVEALAPTIGDPSLVVALDSGCATYDRLWATTSLRGLVNVVVTVRVLDEGVHSGSAGGVVPSSFRVLRQLLDRVEDSATGAVLVPALQAPVPPDRAAELAATAAELGLDGVAGGFPVDRNRTAEAVLRARTWEPSVAYVGADGFAPVATAGNVLRASTAMKLSFRLPPTADAPGAAAAVRDVLLADPPSGATVSVDVLEVGTGWNAPPFDPWLADALAAASEHAYGAPARTIGEGGSIPFMGMLGQRFPAAQFLITGVLGAGSNAHGPNESLHVPYAVRLTEAVAHVLDAHAARPR
jgi:acetylornithine deacetylase/succinyl-diaminopimelate desuccinylase-like protein